MNWTTDQQKVIDLRDRNILVSAAAGSGKTAVLVARIIDMISKGETKVDIDRLLIVTFTNAAAAEMRERIGKAIDEMIKKNPNDPHLQRQATLIHSAQITTIHSFCLYVIRNYFNTINLDPSFRIAEEAELTLLKGDVIGDLLEEYYEEENEDFYNFIECFSSGKSDTPIEELILKLHNLSMSHPWPEEWLHKNLETFSINTLKDMKISPWMGLLLKHLGALIDDLIIKCNEAIGICEEIDGPKAYLPAIRSDLSLLTSLARLEDYEQYHQQVSDLSFQKLSGKKEEGVSADKKAQVKLLRDEIKKSLGDLKKNYFFQSPEDMLADIKAMKIPMEVLTKLTIDFASMYSKKKQEKNIVDFNDLEHFCLNILVKSEDGREVFTQAADELSKHYVEIMIDEYQDSNNVQETILKSISGERFSHPNLFMVGDVKQSIYKFRLARPEIFMEKFDTYSTLDSLYQRVDLHKNFRSREVVINSINYIFEQIMAKKLGNVEYDEEAFLYPGADFGDLTEGVSQDTEIILISTNPPETNLVEEQIDKTDDIIDESEEEEEEYTSKEIEAKAIAKRIKELTDPDSGLVIFDKNKKKFRKALYGDIVILLRTISGWAEVFSDTLAAEGLPAHTETRSGYFSTLEIRTILNLLRIIDNPRQDIPFVSVLRSPIVDISSNDLADIRVSRKHMSMYEAAIDYVEEESEKGALTGDDLDTCGKKLKKFLGQLKQYRNMVFHLPIHELILKVLEDTGYYTFISAMPSGDKRKANVDMLLQKAIRFESTSYRGLFHFVRYIEKLHKYDVDFGEAKLINENDNTIKIMSIHKSKGLEFPIVFVAGTGKSFNNQDSRSKLLVHPDLGLGPEFIDYKQRIKAPTLVKKVIQKELVLENLGEELRVLYVALTRAKEKLIIIGGVKNLRDSLAKWGNIVRQDEKQLLFYQLSNASNYLDFIIPALMRHKSSEALSNMFLVNPDVNNPLYHRDANFVYRTYDYQELAEGEYEDQVIKRMCQDELIHWDNRIVYDEEARKKIIDHVNYKYPYQTETSIHAKLTVSELKRLGQMEAEEFSAFLHGSHQSKEIPVPNFISKKETLSGARLGTLYHAVLEKMNLLHVQTKTDLEKYISDLINTGKITEEESKTLDIDKLLIFTQSQVANRIRKAKEQEKLYTERQFIMGMKARDINVNMHSDEVVLIQGVIDLYFEEEGQLVLLDYKTDIVEGSDGEDILIKRYFLQLKFYQKALEQLTGKKVKEKIIYSFGLNKPIQLPN